MKKDEEPRSEWVNFKGGLGGRLAKFHGSRRWQMTWWWNGREKRESTGTSDLKAAKRVLKAKLEHLQAVKRGTEPLVDAQAKRQTVGELLDALERDLTLREVKGLVQAKSTLKAVRSAFGAYRALVLSPEIVDQQIEMWRAEGKADATINRRVQLLGQAFRLAQERGRVAAVPVLRCALRPIMVTKIGSS